MGIPFLQAESCHSLRDPIHCRVVQEVAADVLPEQLDARLGRAYTFV